MTEQTMIPSLELLTDDDLNGLAAWATPLAQMQARFAVAAWGKRAWQSVIDEQNRRSGDSTLGVRFPAVDALSNEEIMFVGQLLAGIHDAGSDMLRVWVEETARFWSTSWSGGPNPASSTTTTSRLSAGRCTIRTSSRRE